MNAAELAVRYNMLAAAHGLAVVLLVISFLTALSAYRSFRQVADLFWMVCFITLILVQVGYIWEALILKQSIRLLNDELVDTFAQTTNVRLPFATFNALGMMLLLLAFRARRSLF